MTFSTEIAKAASNKFYLVRMTCARNIFSDMTLVSSGAGINKYQITLNEADVASVSDDNGGYSRVTTLTGGGVEYTYSNGVLTIDTLIAVPPTFIIVEFYLLFTDGIARDWYSDPDDTTSNPWIYQPFIQKVPTVKQNVENTINGFLSIQSGNLVLNNTGNELNQYFYENRSFYNKDVEMWICANDLTNRIKIFKGPVKKATVSNEQVTFVIKDSFARLDDPAVFNYIGDGNGDDSYLTEDAFASLDPAKSRAIAPFYLGHVGEYQVETYSGITSAEGYILDPTSLLELNNLSYTSATPSTTNNRTWGLIRAATAYSTGGANSESGVTYVSDTTDTFLLGVSDASLYHVGDQLTVDPGVVDAKVTVINIFTDTDQIRVRLDSGALGSGDFPAPLRLDAMNVVIDIASQNSAGTSRTTAGPIYLVYTTDWTLSTEAQNFGTGYKVVFNNNFEASYAQFNGTSFDPAVDKVYFRYRDNGARKNHAQAVQYFFDTLGSFLGFTDNASSFTAAQSALDMDVTVRIPKVGATSYNSYRSIIEDILRSSFGYLYVDESFQVNYNLFAQPTSTTEVDANELELLSEAVEIEYQDIVTGLLPYNPMLPVGGEYFSDCNERSPVIQLYKAAQESIVGIRNRVEFEHLGIQFDAVSTDLINVLSERRHIYVFSAPHTFLDKQIGEDFKLVDSLALREAGEVTLKIIGIEKSPDGVVVIATDLYNLT